MLVVVTRVSVRLLLQLLLEVVVVVVAVRCKGIEGHVLKRHLPLLVAVGGQGGCMAPRHAAGTMQVDAGGGDGQQGII
jgi:hypothetical protein